MYVFVSLTNFFLFCAACEPNKTILHAILQRYLQFGFEMEIVFRHSEEMRCKFFRLNSILSVFLL